MHSDPIFKLPIILFVKRAVSGRYKTILIGFLLKIEYPDPEKDSIPDELKTFLRKRAWIKNEVDNNY
jgi:hypothetical protein